MQKKMPNKKQLHELYAFYYALNQDRGLITKEALAENRKLLNFFKSVQPWAELYSHPPVTIVLKLLRMIDCLDPIINATKSEDKTQAIMSVINNLMDGDLDDQFEKFSSFTESERGVCFSQR